MSRAVLLAVALALAGAAGASERTGVIAIADPPYGPDADLAELAHQLRAACRDRIGGVEEVSTMRARLLGQASNASLSELDRAYGGALAVYQNGEFDSAFRTLRAIIEDLESIPENEEAYAQWERGLLRLAHAAQTIGMEAEAERALLKLAKTDPNLRPDADQYSPSYRRRFEELKGKVRALPRRRLQVVAEGRSGTVFLNGRAMGATPLTLTLPAGSYRIGGAAGSLRVPSFVVDVETEDRSVVLDFALSESLRVNAGPGLALPVAQRSYGIIRAGAWLGVDRLVVASRAEEGGAQFLLGSIYDVRRGALLREGSVRMVAGSVPSVNLSALASFLLTGQSSRDVKDRTRDAPRELLPPSVGIASGGAPVALVTPLAAAAAPASDPAEPVAAPPPVTPRPVAPPPLEVVHPPAPIAAAAVLHPAPPGPPDLRAALPPPAVQRDAPPAALAAASSARGWTRPTAIGSGVAALAFGGLAIQQGLSASRANGDADAMLGSGGVLRPGSDPSRYQGLRQDGEAASRNAYVSAGAAVALAAAAGAFGWLSWDRPPEPTLALRF
jgi:tetratricopeptide (TPR) repeat protein